MGNCKVHPMIRHITDVIVKLTLESTRFILSRMKISLSMAKWLSYSKKTIRDKSEATICTFKMFTKPTKLKWNLITKHSSFSIEPLHSIQRPTKSSKQLKQFLAK